MQMYLDGIYQMTDELYFRELPEFYICSMALANFHFLNHHASGFEYA